MTKKPKMRWSKSDAEKLETVVKSFNKKIYNTRHRRSDLKDILPDTIKESDKQRMIEEFKNMPRNEFNKKIKSLERFMQKDAVEPIKAKTGNVVTKWEKKEVSYKVAQINRDRTRERKAMEQMDVTSRGEPVGLKRGEMGSVRMNELKPKKFNFDNIRGGKEWEKYKASIDKLSSPLEKSERMEKYKRNYLGGMESAFGEHADELYSIVEELPAELILEKFYTEQEATIDFYYEPQEMQLKLDILTELWTNIAKEYKENIEGEDK